MAGKCIGEPGRGDACPDRSSGRPRRIFRPGRIFSQAAERLLGEQSGTLEQIEREERTQKRIFFIGVTQLGHKDLQVYRARNEKIRIEGYGILILEKDMDDLIRDTVEGISVRGKVFCSERIRKIYLPTY